MLSLLTTNYRYALLLLTTNCRYSLLLLTIYCRYGLLLLTTNCRYWQLTVCMHRSYGQINPWIRVFWEVKPFTLSRNSSRLWNLKVGYRVYKICLGPFSGLLSPLHVIPSCFYKIPAYFSFILLSTLWHGVCFKFFNWNYVHIIISRMHATCFRPSYLPLFNRPNST